MSKGKNKMPIAIFRRQPMVNKYAISPEEIAWRQRLHDQRLAKGWRSFSNGDGTGTLVLPQVECKQAFCKYYPTPHIHLSDVQQVEFVLASIKQLTNKIQ
jgi:hypothetical protein